MFSTDPVVHVKGVSIFHDHNTILGDVSFDIQKGEFVYHGGANGLRKIFFIKNPLCRLSAAIG